MKLYKTSGGQLLEHDGAYYRINNDWDELLQDDRLYARLQEVTGTNEPTEDYQGLLDSLAPPIQSQELWASGVTYFNSKLARQEEAEAAGGGDFYARVYEADRPELFFKATRQRVVGPAGKVRIRKDSGWDVPEPELTLAVSASGKIIGYTIGNDMSSRSIEGENPLYLPQAKTYDGCAAIGPCILVVDEPLPASTRIGIEISRDGASVFSDEIPLSKMKRQLQDLVDYLYRECSFPQGCLLMTGTGIVPTKDFTLQSGDEISITIDQIGTLVNTVA